MLLNSWSIALSIVSITVLFVTLVAAGTAIRVIRYWDSSSDTSRQIQLENEIWLSSTLMEYGLVFQILSLLLLILAADSFSDILVGAMCATGSFLANNFGIFSLFIKLVSVFFYGFWIVLHRLDTSSPSYPLVKQKYVYLLVLSPLLLADSTVQTLYLAKLQPDIITSCCGVIFQDPALSKSSLSKGMADELSTLLFYCNGFLLLALSLLIGQLNLKRNTRKFFLFLLSAGALAFYPFGLWIITNFVSPYVYAMPHHRCPFCLIEHEYYFIGYPLFISLTLGVFLILSLGVVELFRKKNELTDAIDRFQAVSLKLSTILLTLFLLLCSLFPVLYFIRSGEV